MIFLKFLIRWNIPGVFFQLRAKLPSRCSQTIWDLVCPFAEVTYHLEFSLLVCTSSIAYLDNVTLRVTQVLVDEALGHILSHWMLRWAAISKLVLDYFLCRFYVVWGTVCSLYRLSTELEFGVRCRVKLSELRHPFVLLYVHVQIVIEPLESFFESFLILLVLTVSKDSLWHFRFIIWFCIEPRSVLIFIYFQSTRAAPIVHSRWVDLWNHLEQRVVVCFVANDAGVLWREWVDSGLAVLATSVSHVIPLFSFCSNVNQGLFFRSDPQRNVILDVKSRYLTLPQCMCQRARLWI